MPSPRFRLDSPEDSLFLPRCGHAVRSHFASGAGKWGDCQMTIKANGRSALILATGLLVCFAGPSQAAGTDSTAASANSESAAPLALNKYTKHSAHHAKSYAHHKSSKLAQKSSDKKGAATDAAADNSDNSSAIPPAVANANAQLATGDVPGGNAKAMSTRANDIVQSAPDNPAMPRPAPMPRSSPPISSTTSIARCTKPAHRPHRRWRWPRPRPPQRLPRP